MTRILAVGLFLVLSALAAGAQPQFRNAGAVLVAETITNRVVESGEDVSVSLALKNVGNEAASNLVATIQSGNGVGSPAPLMQNYGTLLPWGPSVAREFAFTANGPVNSLLFVNLDLEDSGRNLGTVNFRFRIGPQITSVINSESITINASGPAATYPSVLSVSNVPGMISSVSVTLSNLSHTFPDDLDILLVSPDGDNVLLMSDACGGTDFNDVTLTFTDSATALLPDVGLPEARVVRPTNHPLDDSLGDPAPRPPYANVMSAFNGKIANGDWKLFIWDDQPGDAGMLNKGWSMTITTMQRVDGVPTLTCLGTTNDMIRLSVSGRPGHSYAIESSPDPVQSFPLESFVMPTGGVQIFEYPIDPGNRFFRAATDP